MTADQKALLVSHENVQAHRLEKAAGWLADERPPSAVHALLGGGRGLEHVPEPADRRTALLDALRLKGGSDRSYLGMARRALEKLREFAAWKSVCMRTHDRTLCPRWVHWGSLARALPHWGL
jgi:hypothetical protein